jgi:hypothetical protein
MGRYATSNSSEPLTGRYTQHCFPETADDCSAGHDVELRAANAAIAIREGHLANPVRGRSVGL